MSERVAITELKPGMVIVRVTQQNGPVKIRKSGLVTSEAMIEGLAEMGVQEVEVDPAQTVEIATETTSTLRPKTQTQALLRGDHDTSAKFDHALSDQFNRSLFLPTVQGLPSLWKVYTRQVLTFAILLLGGASIGFTAATHSLWWPGIAEALSSTSSAPTSSETAAQPVAQPENQLNQDAVDTPPTSTVPGTNPQLAVVSSPSSSQASTSNQLASAGTSDANNVSQPETDTGNTVNTEMPASQENAQQAAVDSQPEQEGTVLNERPDSDNVSVSPELMARFNAAVEAMDKQATDPDPRTKVTVRNDLPRVDQLPVRLLTRLPTMNFSAHMYASRSRDRWVRVNGMQLGEGDWIDDKVQIVNIEAQQVILSFEDELFTMAALTDW